MRVSASPGKGTADAAALAAAVPPGLACASNLGAVDFFPATSGKEAAAAYLLQRWGVSASEAVLLCDDDNDLQLAAAVGRAHRGRWGRAVQMVAAGAGGMLGRGTG